MKKFITYICCLLIVISSLVLGGSLFSKHVISETLLESTVAQMQVEDKLQEVFDSLNIPDIGIAGEIETMIEDVAGDPEVSEEVNKYTDAILEDILNDNESEVTSNLNQVLKDKLKEYSATLASLSQGLLSKDVIDTAFEEAIDFVDIQQQYDTVLEEMKDNFSPTERLIIRTVNILRSDLCTIASLIVMVVASLFVLMLNLTYLSGLPYLAISYFLSFIFMVIARIGIPMVMNIAFERALSVHEVEIDVSSLNGLILIYLAIFIGCVVVKLIYNKVSAD